MPWKINWHKMWQSSTEASRSLQYSYESGNFCSWFKYCGPNARRYLCGRRKTQSCFTSLPQTFLDGHSLRSSDCCSRSRNFYSKLFPDSKYADINCGRTKAGYIIKFALGSYCKELIISEMADKPFAIHVDESMYHSKVRLEFWVIHFVKQIRRVRYMTTIELKTNFDVSAFLTSDSSLKSLDDVKLVSLLLQNVIHVMTDNCSTMRGSKDGFVSKMKTVCNNLVDVEGCSSYQGNLLTKDMIKEFPFVKAVVNFVENLSNFVENKPKVRSILKESSAFLGISRLPDYAETRFLNLYLVIEAIVTQYPVIKKILGSQIVRKMSFSKVRWFIRMWQFGIWKTFRRDLIYPPLTLRTTVRNSGSK